MNWIKLANRLRSPGKKRNPYLSKSYVKALGEFEGMSLDYMKRYVEIASKLEKQGRW